MFAEKRQRLFAQLASFDVLHGRLQLFLLHHFHLRAFSERMVLGVNGQSLGVVYQKRLRGTVAAAEFEVNTEQILAAAPYQSSSASGSS